MVLNGIVQNPDCDYPVEYTLTIDENEEYDEPRDFNLLIEGDQPDPNIITIFIQSTTTIYWYV